MRTIPHVTTLAFLALFSPLAHGQETSVGKMTAMEFRKINATAGEKIMAIKATDKALSKEDQALLTEIVEGGTMQLKASEIAVDLAKAADVKIFAQAELEEQTGLAAKLKEIASSKGATLPEKPDAKTEKDVAALKEKSGAEFDAAYIRMTGVQGHEKLLTVMTQVEKEAKDENLKEIAKIALPLIKVHLAAAKEEEAKGK